MSHLILASLRAWRYLYLFFFFLRRFFTETRCKRHDISGHARLRHLAAGRIDAIYYSICQVRVITKYFINRDRNDNNNGQVIPRRDA